MERNQSVPRGCKYHQTSDGFNLCEEARWVPELPRNAQSLKVVLVLVGVLNGRRNGRCHDHRNKGEADQNVNHAKLQDQTGFSAV